MYAFELCRDYQIAINSGKLEAALALFDPTATVTTPLVGTLGVADYHKRLLSHTSQAITRLLNVYEGLNAEPSIGLHLHHTWILRNGAVATFDAMNVFELSSDRTRFTRLTIIFDSGPVRATLGKEQLASLTLQEA